MGQVISLAAIWAVAIAGFVVASWRSAPTAARKEFERVARRTGIGQPVDPKVVLDRFVSRWRGQVVGVACGLLWPAVATSLMPLQGDPGGQGAWWVVAVPLGSAVGAGVGTLMARPAVPDGCRAASMTPRVAADYLPAVERWGTAACLVAVAAAMVVTGVFFVAGEPDPFTYLALSASLVSLGVWVWTGRLGRRLLHQPAPAADGTELAWHETLRALALRDVWTVRSSVALFAGSVPAVALLLDRGRLRDPDGAAGDVLVWVGLLLLLSILAIAVLLTAVQLADRRLGWFRTHAGKGVVA